MAPSPDRLSALFRRYYAGIATPAETDELMALIRISENDHELAGALRHAWEHTNEKHFEENESEQMLNAILAVEAVDEPSGTPFRIQWVRYAAAAAVIILATTFAFYKTRKQPSDSQQITKKTHITTDVPPGGNRALLVLADGVGIPLDSTRNGLLASTGGGKIVKTDDGKLTVSAGNPADGPLLRNLLTTPKGGQYQITLSDGSRAWLNASSSIRFPATFAAHERRVEITGEVFFEVTKDKKRPFRVKFSDSEVEVLGTSFNVMAYPDEEASKTTLLEGSVRLSNAGKSRMLTPGEQGAIRSDGAIVTAAVDTRQETAWREGLFYFRDSGIREIMRDASRWYDIEVEYRGKIPERQFTGKVSRNVNISELLNMLRYAGVRSTIENQKVIISM